MTNETQATQYETEQIKLKVHGENEARRLRHLIETPLKAICEKYTNKQIMVKDSNLKKEFKDELDNVLKECQKAFNVTPYAKGLWANISNLYISNTEYSLMVNMRFNFQSAIAKDEYTSTPNFYYEYGLYLCDFKSDKSFDDPRNKRLTVYETKAENVQLYDVNELIAQFNNAKKKKYEYEQEKEKIKFYAVRTLLN